MTRWWREPRAGALVWCLFPQDKQLEPGPKPRPALIITVKAVLNADQQYAVRVVYGTSKKVDALRSGEFLIDRSDSEAFQLAGLSYPTKFDLSQIAELPYNSEWFSIPPRPRHGQNPKIGILHPSLVPRLKAAREAAKGA